MSELSNQYGLMRLMIYAMERQYDDIITVLFDYFPQDTNDTVYCSGMFTVTNDSLPGLKTVWPYLRHNSAFLQESLREAAWKNQKDMVRFMVNSWIDGFKGDLEDALRAAIYHRDVEMVRLWLLESVDPRTPMALREEDSEPVKLPCALFSAVAQGDTEILAMIIDKDEMVQPDKGIMPGLLEAALSLHNYSAADLLLARGADILEVSLDTAVSTGRKDTVKTLLQSGRRDFQSVLYGSVLQRACTLGDMGTAKLLLEYGHAINPKSPMALGGNSPLMGAIMGGHVELVEFLVLEGASVQGARSVFGNAIPTALWLDRRDVVRILVEHNASCS
ncbi:ankyrin repeat-containing domain protein [Aspergillus germanicus]